MAKVKKINKKHILSRLTLVPLRDKRLFYMREMHFLNILCERYSVEFMDIASFDKKFDSLAYLVSDKLTATLDKKFIAFNYVVDHSKYDVYNIGEKVGEDLVVDSPPKTVRDFLNG